MINTKILFGNKLFENHHTNNATKNSQFIYVRIDTYRSREGTSDLLVRTYRLLLLMNLLRVFNKKK